MKNIGKIDVTRISKPPEKREFETAKFLSQLGKDIEFIEPSRCKGARTPDIIMDGLKWEIKCPTGKSSRTIENNFRAGLRQSENIILDIRRCKLYENKSIGEIGRQFKLAKKAKRVIIITKKGKILDYAK